MNYNEDIIFDCEVLRIQTSSLILVKNFTENKENFWCWKEKIYHRGQNQAGWGLACDNPNLACKKFALNLEN